jgi:16S rRNA U516 pseudouridylate synthase RsuA-like enzyme
MVGLKVISLKRISEDGLQLGDLKSGSWRYLKPSEIEMLRKNR